MIHADLECLVEKMHSCQNNPEKSYTEKKKLSMHLLVTHCFQIVHLMKKENKLDCYKREDCMERFCKDLREHAMKIINNEEKEMIPLTSEENKSYKKQKFVIYVKKNLVLLKMIKMHLNYTMNSETIAITPEWYLQFKIQNTKRNSNSVS